MKKTLALLVSCTLICLTLPGPSGGQVPPDPELAAAIAEIRVIDNHAHPLRALKEGERDREWGDLSYHAPAASAKDSGALMPLIPFRLRPKSPEYLRVWQTLYGLPQGSIPGDFLSRLTQAKRKIMLEQGDNYPSWVLDKLGIEIMLANRVTMDRSLPASRFRWVPYVDALMYPLSNHRAKQARPDLVKSYESLERLLNIHLSDAEQKQLPSRLDAYLTRVVTPTLERMKQEGAVAIKFQTAYVRPLDIANPPEKQAKHVYERYIRKGNPAQAEYKVLQDYLFRYLSREAGRLGLPVHIHTGLGIGEFFDVTGSDPLLLEGVFNDPVLRKTDFVLLHGGWPFTKHTAAMLLKPNVYADFSAINFMFYPREVSDVLRSWLTISPDKVLFGTDGFELDPDMPFINWEEFSCLAVHSARQAVTGTLTEMMRDGEITRDQALDIARKILRDNAVKLYKFPDP